MQRRVAGGTEADLGHDERGHQRPQRKQRVPDPGSTHPEAG
jgi:hypothetical protein